MKNFLLFLFRYSLVVLLIFFFQRTIFLCANWNVIRNQHLSDVLLTFLYGVRFDLAALGYVLIPPFIILSVHAAGWFKFPSTFLKTWNMVLVILIAIINCSDIGINGAWGMRLNERALSYIVYPKEILASLRISELAILIILIGMHIGFGIFLFRRFLPSKNLSISKIQFVLTLPLLLILMIIGIRGGVQLYPINKGNAYFSAVPSLNNAALNSQWNLVYTLTHITGNKNFYKVMPESDAQVIIDSRFKKTTGTFEKILTTDRPNIIFIQLESWSTDVVHTFGGEKDITPGFDSLCREGIYFSNFYASGYRTEHGLVSIISGFPAQPQTSIIRNIGKFENLPSMVKQLDSAGYWTGAYYGGGLAFANTGAYLYSCGFRKIIGDADFEIRRRTSWGAEDEELFEFVKNDLSKVKQPFLSYIQTISSHEPFETKGDHVLPGNDEPVRYRNSVNYTDHCLREFFRKARQEPWFANTLFILLADHSHSLPLNRTFADPRRFQIPIVFYGDVLKLEFRGKKMERYGSQIDLPATLLSQLNLQSDAFKWSHNLFQEENPALSYFTYDNGFGIADKDGILIHDNEQKKITHFSGDEKNKDILFKRGSAIQQTVQQDFIHF